MKTVSITVEKGVCWNWCQKIEKTMIEKENVEGKTSKGRKPKVKNVERKKSKSKISKEVSSKTQNTERDKLEKSIYRKVEISTRQFRKMSPRHDRIILWSSLLEHSYDRQPVFHHPSSSFQSAVIIFFFYSFIHSSLSIVRGER